MPHFRRSGKANKCNKRKSKTKRGESVKKTKETNSKEKSKILGGK